MSIFRSKHFAECTWGSFVDKATGRTLCLAPGEQADVAHWVVPVATVFDDNGEPVLGRDGQPVMYALPPVLEDLPADYPDPWLEAVPAGRYVEPPSLVVDQTEPEPAEAPGEPSEPGEQQETDNA